MHTLKKKKKEREKRKEKKQKIRPIPTLPVTERLRKNKQYLSVTRSYFDTLLFSGIR